MEAEVAAACEVPILKKRKEKETAAARRNNNNNNNHSNNSSNSNMADITITIPSAPTCFPMEEKIELLAVQARLANKVAEAAEKERDGWKTVAMIFMAWMAVKIIEELIDLFRRLRNWWAEKMALRPLAAEQLAEAAVLPKWSEAEPGNTNAMGVNIVVQHLTTLGVWGVWTPVVLDAFGLFI
ncbi:hypothetical protein PG995_007730 [Apiospora arundinis]